MNFTRENARGHLKDAKESLCRVFGAYLTGGVDAVFPMASGETVLGAAGLPFDAPVCNYIRNHAVAGPYVGRFLEHNQLFVFGDSVRHYTEEGEMPLPDGVRTALLCVVSAVCESAGVLDENGDHILDLKAMKIGTHFDVNLLIGNRIGYPSPLLTTPKGALDSLGRGSFRGEAARQVTATRYNLIPEENGEPANRQFYLVENGRQIFYSADPETNVETAVCRHSQNRTVITYETSCGLRITRTLFILPQEEGMPEAVEAQHVAVENRSGRDRRVKIVFTGMFGLASPESAMNDIIYASVTWESSLLLRNGCPAALSPHPHPPYLKPLKRFAALLAEGGFMDEYTANYMDFIGNGTLSKPQNVAALSNTPITKMVPFFALGKTLSIPAGKTSCADLLVGMVLSPGGADDRLDAALGRLLDAYCQPGKTEEALAQVERFQHRYAGYLNVRTDDGKFDAYVNHNLPFQVYYQSYVSRSFAWTQKAYREIGFREIQDMYASLYYITGMGEGTLAREMLGEWISNVHEMGYANHNFYSTGKEPGMCSDDGLWLIPAVFRYVSLTGDIDFLNAEYRIAGMECRRTVLETMLAIVRYSGKISVGAHGLPLLDKADWNDCLKLDNDWIDGPEKEKRYRAQLEQNGEAYGVPFRSEYSESVMNAFLLKIAYDDVAAMASMRGDSSLGKEMQECAAALAERIQSSAWKDDFFARALIGGTREGDYTYLGAGGDGLSMDEGIPGSYFLNSFSWSILAGVASDAQIRTMLTAVKRYLVTDAGVKLCTPCDLSKLASGNATSAYFPGDRENGGVFKHAAMMMAAACFKAAKTVEDASLAEELSSLAFFAMDTVLPYKTLEHPFTTKGNPRFCTQYNNSITGENIGPMLSGTASWLCLTVFEMLGIRYDGDDMVFSPVLPEHTQTVEYTLTSGKTAIRVCIRKPDGFVRVTEKTTFTLDGVPFRGRIARPDDSKEHVVEIIM